MQFNKYASLLFALMAGIAVTSNHKHSLLIAVILISIAGLWANGLLFNEE